MSQGKRSRASAIANLPTVEWSIQLELAMLKRIKPGDTLMKRSGLKFKSGRYRNTVKAFAKAEFSDRVYVTFNEDDSKVELWKCVLVS